MTETLIPGIIGFTIGNVHSVYPNTAFDGVIGTGNESDGSWYCYDTGYVSTGWVGKQYTIGKTLTKVRLRTWNWLSDPKDFTIQGSNNGSSWTTLSTVTNASKTSGWTDYPVTNSTQYTYYRVNISSNWGDGTYLVIADIEFYQTDTAPLPVVFDILDPTHTATNNGLTITKSSGGANSPSKVYTEISSGKVYFEFHLDADAPNVFTGFCTNTAFANFPGYDSYSWSYYPGDGKIYHNNSSSAYGPTANTGDIIGVAVDMDNGKVYFSKNNTWLNSSNPVTQTNPAVTGLSGTVYPAISLYTINDAITGRFKSSDLTYTPPTGFSSLGGTVVPDAISLVAPSPTPYACGANDIYLNAPVLVPDVSGGGTIDPQAPCAYPEIRGGSSVLLFAPAGIMSINGGNAVNLSAPLSFPFVTNIALDQINIIGPSSYPEASGTSLNNYVHLISPPAYASACGGCFIALNAPNPEPSIDGVVGISGNIYLNSPHAYPLLSGGYDVSGNIGLHAPNSYPSASGTAGGIGWISTRAPKGYPQASGLSAGGDNITANSPNSYPEMFSAYSHDYGILRYEKGQIR